MYPIASTPMRCPTMQHYLCPDNRTCILPTSNCDIYQKCPRYKDTVIPPDGLNCVRKQPGPCPYDLFRCVRTLQCISPQFRCDGRLDCGPSDSSDEEQCPPQQCTARQTPCASGQCWPTESFCDGQRQCADDELPSICGE